jgi:hypothetical protein
MGDPHVVLELGHVLFGCRFFRKRPGQHELGFEYRSGPLNEAVEGGHHPLNGRMLDAALDGPHAAAGVALVPGAIELLGDGPELHDQIPRQVLGRHLATLFSPETDQGRFIVAHDDPGIRTAYE